MVVIERTVDLSRPVQTETLRGSEFTGEQRAHTFRINVTRNGEPVELDGTLDAKKAVGQWQRLDLEGSIVNNAAGVTLLQACYGVPGQFRLSIYVRTS